MLAYTGLVSVTHTEYLFKGYKCNNRLLEYRLLINSIINLKGIYFRKAIWKPFPRKLFECRKKNMTFKFKTQVTFILFLNYWFIPFCLVDFVYWNKILLCIHDWSEIHYVTRLASNLQQSSCLYLLRLVQACVSVLSYSFLLSTWWFSLPYLCDLMENYLRV